jgi:hypothetical protein
MGLASSRDFPPNVSELIGFDLKTFLFSSRFFSFLIFFPFESGFELLFYEFFSAGSFGFLIFWFVRSLQRPSMEI